MYVLDLYSKILKSRFITHTPFAVSHLVTSLCNCRCKTCNLWKKSSNYKNDLTKEEIFKMLDNAKKAGVCIYSVWGGEPLLRKDLPEILQYAKKKNLITILITNGFFLKDLSSKIVPFVDHFIVSIDSNDDLHDKMRGVKGIRKRAIEGIKLCKKEKKDVIINCVLSRLNLNKIEGLLDLSKELGTSIMFEPMQVSKDYNVNERYNEQLKPSKEEAREAFLKIIKAKKSGYRVGNSFECLRNFSENKKYTCHMPKVIINVDANGDIFSCLGQTWGNIKNKHFKEIFTSDKYKEFCKKVEKCNICDISCVIEVSVGYSLNPLFFLDKNRDLFN